MVNKSDDTAVDKEDKDKIVNTTTVSYEDRAGAKYSYTKVLIVGADEESNPDKPKFDAAFPLSL